MVIVIVMIDARLWSQILSAKITEKTSYNFLDIGQGDSKLIIFPGNVKLLIDGGSTARVLKALGDVLPVGDRYIDIMLMTHPQLDHFGGFIDVLKAYKVGVFLGTGRAATIGAYKVLEEEIKLRNVPYVKIMQGDRITYGGVTVDVLSPDAHDLRRKELNDGCLVTKINDGELTSLFMCDASANIEEKLIQRYNLRADILKVGHHGSRFSSGVAFLKAVNPKVAVIEVGKNSYGHPTPQTLNRLAELKIPTYRTDTDGTIIIRSDNGMLKIYKKQR